MYIADMWWCTYGVQVGGFAVTLGHRKNRRHTPLTLYCSSVTHSLCSSCARVRRLIFSSGHSNILSILLTADPSANAAVLLLLVLFLCISDMRWLVSFTTLVAKTRTTSAAAAARSQSRVVVGRLRGRCTPRRAHTYYYYGTRRRRAAADSSGGKPKHTQRVAAAAAVCLSLFSVPRTLFYLYVCVYVVVYAERERARDRSPRGERSVVEKACDYVRRRVCIYTRVRGRKKRLL